MGFDGIGEESSVTHRCQVCRALSDPHAGAASAAQTSGRPLQIRFSISDSQEGDSSSLPKLKDWRSEARIRKKPLHLPKGPSLWRSWNQAPRSWGGTQLTYSGKGCRVSHEGLSFCWRCRYFCLSLTHRLPKGSPASSRYPSFWVMK